MGIFGKSRYVPRSKEKRTLYQKMKDFIRGVDLEDGNVSSVVYACVRVISETVASMFKSVGWHFLFLKHIQCPICGEDMKDILSCCVTFLYFLWIWELETRYKRLIFTRKEEQWQF